MPEPAERRDELALITDPVFERHGVPSGHPECPERVTSAQSVMGERGADPSRWRRPPRATRAQLERVHTPAYVQSVFDAAPADGLVPLDHETTMGPNSLEAAERAAGAVCLAVDLALAGTAPRAFCAVRPPGHHARADTVAGFCIFNNVAVGAAHALAQNGIERVAIVDFDVHHGDGTEAIYRDDPRVLMCSTYQHPLYPGVNLPSIPGSQVNVPLPAGTGSEAFRAAVREHWLPELDAFAPQIVLISAGFDAHRDDPLGGLALDEDDFGWATGEMRRIAERHAEGRTIAVMEGGYDIAAIARSARAVIDALQD